MTDFLERFEVGTRLRLEGGQKLDGTWLEIEKFSIHKERPLIKFRGIDKIGAAEALQWAYLGIPELDRPELDEDEYLTKDLIGLKVTTIEGQELGSIEDVIAMPAHDVIKIGELLIPAVGEFIKGIDLKAGTMTVKLIPGMLD